MDMQNDVVVLVYARRNIQRNAGKKWLQRDCGCCRGCRASRSRAANIGYKKIIRANFQYRFLVIQGGNARTGKHMHTPLRLKKIQQRSKVTGLECQAKQRPSCRGGIRQTAARRTDRKSVV